MAKKILYKVTSYHCPRCGGVTDPKKKYCDYCDRDLAIRRNKISRKVRMLIDCGNYVFFDEIKAIDTDTTAPVIDCTTLEDCRVHTVRGMGTENKISVTMATNTDRGRELSDILFSGIHKVRFELLEIDLGYEQECYISEINRNYFSEAMGMQTINFIGVGEMEVGSAIPSEVLAEFRCPNCGAPILSRYCACDYCSGWSEVEW